MSRRWVIGIGRIGAMIAPAIVGFLIDGGWKTSKLYYAFAIPLVITMLTTIARRDA